VFMVEVTHYIRVGDHKDLSHAPIRQIRPYRKAAGIVDSSTNATARKTQGWQVRVNSRVGPGQTR
jgi:hypothetical protein